MKYLLIMSLLFLNNTTIYAASMTQALMEKIVVDNVDVIKHKKGYLLFTYKKVKMALISDVKHDRMRIISAITKYPSLNIETKNAVMESNFHLALDSRYAVSQDVLYSAYIHPLSSLTKNELKSALSQVSTLATTFGTTYSSGKLVFKGNAKNNKSQGN